MELLILRHSPLINGWFWKFLFYSRLTHFERMYSYRGIATLLILTLTLNLLLMIVIFFFILQIIEMTTPWVLTPQHTMFDLDAYLPIFHTQTSNLWYHYTYIYLVKALHSLLQVYIFHRLTWPYPILSIKWGCKPVLSFLVEFHIPLDVRFNIFHDSKPY